MRSPYQRNLWARTESLKSLITVVVVKSYLTAAGLSPAHRALGHAHLTTSQKCVHWARGLASGYEALHVVVLRSSMMLWALRQNLVSGS
jgi:hypothetical protein